MISMPRIARLVDLVPFISSHQGIPIATLAEKFQISTEELQEDLFLLWCCGLPGHTPLELMDFEFESGFVSVRNADQLKKPRALSQAEISTLIVGLEVLGTDQARALGNKLRKLIDSAISYEPTYSESFSPRLQKAIEQNFTVSISYNGKIREIIPIEIYCESDAEYLKAFSKSANDRRTFKISKIESLTVSAKHELVPNFVPSSEIRIPVSISVNREARRVREVLGETENFSVFSTEWLISAIFGLGGAVTVLDPKIRAEIKNRAKAALTLYDV